MYRAWSIRTDRLSTILFTAIQTVLYSAPNGVRYPRVGGTRERHFAGTNLKPRKLLENAQTPTRRVHAVLGAFTEHPAKHIASCVQQSSTCLCNLSILLGLDTRYPNSANYYSFAE